MWLFRDVGTWTKPQKKSLRLTVTQHIIRKKYSVASYDIANNRKVVGKANKLNDIAYDDAVEEDFLQEDGHSLLP